MSILFEIILSKNKFYENHLICPVYRQKILLKNCFSGLELASLRLFKTNRFKLHKKTFFC